MKKTLGWLIIAVAVVMILIVFVMIITGKMTNDNQQAPAIICAVITGFAGFGALASED